MKPCSTNRKLIALLAADALASHEERPLRLHLENCEGCRSYHAEVSHTTQKLGALEIKENIQASDAFHQRLMSKLRAEERVSAWQIFWTQIHRGFQNWRVTLPVMGAAAVLITTMLLSMRETQQPAPEPLSKPVVAATVATKLAPEPTISNYQTAANHSLDKLDELLNRQGNQPTSPTPIYTASSSAQVSALE